jgi:hypothetical protein
MHYQSVDGSGPMVGLMIALPLSLTVWSIFGAVAVILA